MELLHSDELPAAVNWILGTIDNVVLAVFAAGVYEVAKRTFRRAPQTVAGIAGAYQNISGILDIVIVRNDGNKKRITDRAIEFLATIDPGKEGHTPSDAHHALINYVARNGGFMEKAITPEMGNALVYAMEIHRQNSDNCAVAPWCSLTTFRKCGGFLCKRHNGVAISINSIKEVLASPNKDTISHVHVIYSPTKRWQTVCIPMDINGMPIDNRIHSLWSIDIDESPSWQIMYTGTPVKSLGGYNCDTLTNINPDRGGVSFGSIDKTNKLRVNYYNVDGHGHTFSTAKEYSVLTAEWLEKNPSKISH